MKLQNGVVLSGKLRDLRVEQVTLGDGARQVVLATLVTDHPAYGGHHRVVFPEDHAVEVQAFAALIGAELEVTVEGWLRSSPPDTDTPAIAAVVVDRAIYLNVTQAQRDMVQRIKRQARQQAAKPRP